VIKAIERTEAWAGKRSSAKKILTAQIKRVKKNINTG
jgi:hypothetical protein